VNRRFGEQGGGTAGSCSAWRQWRQETLPTAVAQAAIACVDAAWFVTVIHLAAPGMTDAAVTTGVSASLLPRRALMSLSELERIQPDHILRMNLEIPNSSAPLIVPSNLSLVRRSYFFVLKAETLNNIQARILECPAQGVMEVRHVKTDGVPVFAEIEEDGGIWNAGCADVENIP
jgi:hypothetical protein